VLRTFGPRVLRSVTAAAGALLIAIGSAPVAAQSRPNESELLADFNHYVYIANLEMAEASARAILDRGLTPTQFLGVVEDSPTMQDRFERAYRRALAMPQLEDVASRLYRLYEDGRLARARDPNEVARNIALLTSGPRGRILGQQRLATAGEYAVPQLLEVLVSRRDQALETEVRALLTAMGRQAVNPMCAALAHVDGPTQETLARLLGRIGYRVAMPYLAQLAQSTTNDAVKQASASALSSMGASADAALSPLYLNLAEEYMGQSRSMLSFPGEPHQLLWEFRPGLGLQATAIVSEVYHEARAMDLAEKAVSLDGTNQEALSLWVAANFSRQFDQPAEYDNPAYPSATRRSASYYAAAAGPQVLERVLMRALASHDTRMAREAIAALSSTAGGTLFSSGGGRSLVEALSYPDRRVRYDAALAIGRAGPTQPFDGSDRVVPILAGVLRDAAKRFALVIADTPQRQQDIRTTLEAMGYTVLAPASRLSETSQTVAEVPGVDLLVSDLTASATADTIDQARRTARLQATPIYALSPSTALEELRSRFEGDPLSRVASQGVTPEQLTAGVEQLVDRASGPPVTEDEATSYANQALDLLHTLALKSGSAAGASYGVFDVGDAAAPLIAALDETTGEVRAKVATALSFIGQQRAQVALMDAAMNASGEDRAMLVEAVIGSAKRYGNLLQERHLRWIIEAAEGQDEAQAMLAASLMGALSLPNERLVPLIAGESRPK